MNKPIYIVIHCSATREDREFTENQVNESHVARGFGKWGYHYYIRKDGRVVKMRAENEIGAHDNCLVRERKSAITVALSGFATRADWIGTERRRIRGRMHRKRL